jgi:hypothetical protein
MPHPASSPPLEQKGAMSCVQNKHHFPRKTCSPCTLPHPTNVRSVDPPHAHTRTQEVPELQQGLTCVREHQYCQPCARTDRSCTSLAHSARWLVHQGQTIVRVRLVLPGLPAGDRVHGRECCLLVLNLVSSTLPCIRRPRPRLRVLDVCGFV